MSDSDMDLPQLNEQDLDMDIDSLDLRLEVRKLIFAEQIVLDAPIDVLNTGTN